jgi:predicted Zn-dependent peptidase
MRQRKIWCFFFFLGMISLNADSRHTPLVEKGLQSVLVSRPEDSLTSILFRLRGGSSWETPQEEGYAHLIEHLIFRGGSSRFPSGAFRHHYRAHFMGGYTTRDTLDFSLVVEPKETLQALEELWDAVFHLEIHKEALKKELQLIENEQKIRGRDVFEKPFSLLFPSSFAHHPLGAPEIWSDLDQHLPRIQAFYQRVYRPEHLRLIVVGAFDEQAIHRFLEPLALPPSPALPLLGSWNLPATPVFSFPSLEASFLFVLSSPHSLSLKLLHRWFEKGCNSFPPLKLWLNESYREIQLWEYQGQSILAIHTLKDQKRGVLEEAFYAYLQGLYAISSEDFNFFIQELFFELEIQWENPLQASELLAFWGEGKAKNLKEIQERIQILPSSVFQSFPWEAFFQIGSVLPDLQKPAPHWKKIPACRIVELLNSRVSTIPLTQEENKRELQLSPFLFLHYHGIPQSTKEGFTLLLGGSGEKWIWKAWAQVLRQKYGHWSGLQIQEDWDSLAFSFSSPQGTFLSQGKKLQHLLNEALPASIIWNSGERLALSQKMESFYFAKTPEFRLSALHFSYQGALSFEFILSFVKTLSFEKSLQDALEGTFVWKSRGRKKAGKPLALKNHSRPFSPPLMVLGAWRGVAPTHPDYLALKILCESLGTHLFEEWVYQQGWAYQVQVLLEDRPQQSLMIVCTEIPFKHQLPFFQSLLSFPPPCPSPLALAQAQSDLKKQYYFSLRSASDFTYSTARSAFLGLGSDLPAQIPSRFEQITLERLQEVYSQYFSPTPSFLVSE